MRKKAFTLIELLAAIVILGLISLLLAPLVNDNIQRSSEQAYKVMVENVENTTRLYINNNRDLIPNINVAGTDTYILLQDLVNKGMTKAPVKDPRDGTDIPLTTKVFIYVLGNNKYDIFFEYRDDIRRTDFTKPVITLIGNNPVTISVGSSYIDAGATAVDNIDGDITANIIVTGAVNANLAGTYSVVYNVKDSAGNSAKTVSRTIYVIDNIPPVVVFGTNGNSTYAKTRSTTVTASDPHSGVNTSSLKYLWNTSTSAPSEASINTSFTNGETISSPAGVTGSHYLWILAKDDMNNTTITRSNVFRLDNTNPVITLLGSNPTGISTGTVYVDAGATASDNIDGNITANIQTVSTVNPNVEGNYTVTYSVSDSSGNAANIVIRTVVVFNPIVTFNHTGNVQTFNVPLTGKYRLEVWGAEGGSSSVSGAVGGLGGYSQGEIILTAGTNLHVYVGGVGQRTDTSTTTNYAGGWNGGGAARGNGTASYQCGTGGGATDIRTIPETNGYRYIRDYLEGSTANTGNHWVEIMAYDKNGNNVALSKPVTGSVAQNSSYPYSRITDGSTDTASYAQSSQSGLQYIEIDLGAEYDIRDVRIWHYYSGGRSYYSTKTILYNANRTRERVIFDSAISGIYAETAAGRTYIPEISSLNSRVIVAGGGGGSGSCYVNYLGGHGGGSSGTSVSSGGVGGTQTAGGNVAGQFGYGGDTGTISRGGGGGGYYGGGAAPNDYRGGGGGSGYMGSSIIPLTSEMINGLHTGNGMARITYIPNQYYAYNYTGSSQTLSITEAGVYEIIVCGGQGGEGGAGAIGGLGGCTKGEIQLNIGNILNIYVGGAGYNTHWYGGAAGGWNGGGSISGGCFMSCSTADEAGSGGGASDVRLNGTNLANRIIVGGGGGGAGGNGATRHGGSGGGLTGGSVASGGAGGTQSAGGATGGTLGVGGSPSSWQAGAGGGGYYGGGASSTILYGGGGGSSYYDGMINNAARTTVGGLRSGSGYVLISYLRP